MSINEIEAYLAAQPEAQRSTLEALQATIRKLAPEAEEGMSYGMPAVLYKGKGLAGYGGYKAHCSYFPMSGSVVEKLADELAGYETSKGGFKFPIGEPPLEALVARLLAARKAEIEGAA